MNPNNFGPNLKRVIIARGLSRKEVCLRTGISYNHLSDILNIRRSPTPSIGTLIKVVKGLGGITFEEILRDQV